MIFDPWIGVNKQQDFVNLGGAFQINGLIGVRCQFTVEGISDYVHRMSKSMSPTRERFSIFWLRMKINSRKLGHLSSKQADTEFAFRPVDIFY
jgi:hypothetical protein